MMLLPKPQKMGEIMAQDPEKAIILHTFGVQVQWGSDLRVPSGGRGHLAPARDNNRAAAHRALSSSFLGLPYRILAINHKN